MSCECWTGLTALKDKKKHLEIPQAFIRSIAPRFENLWPSQNILVCKYEGQKWEFVVINLFFLIVYIGVCLIIKLIYLQNKVVENMEKHEGENIVIHIITIQR